MKGLAAHGPLLAFDTSGTVGSVAVAEGGLVRATARLEHRAEHASRLVPAIQRVLGEASVGDGRPAGVVVGSGPGSFTGVRVAAATAKGLVRGWGVPLWSVTSLEAAAAATEGVGIRYPLFDARSDRVYGACYSLGEASMTEVVAPHAGVLGDVLDGLAPEGALFLGDAAHRHRKEIEGAGFSVADSEGRPTAQGLLRALALRPRGRVLDVPAWEPTYLRGFTTVGR